MSRPLLILLVILCVPDRALTQVVIRIPTDSGYYKPLPRGLDDSYFYIQVGLSQPIGLFGQQPALDASVLDPFRGNTGTGAAPGYSFEMGYRRAFVVDDGTPSRIYPFWGVALGASYNALDWNSLGGYWKQQEMSQFAQGAGLVHLGVALKHNARWVLEAHGGALLPFITFYPDNKIAGAGIRPTDFSVRVKDGTEEWAPGFTGGLTWRTRHFRVGVEFYRHLSNVMYNYWEFDPGTVQAYDACFDQRTVRGYLGVQF